MLRKNYKETGVCFYMRSKRGQVTIFVILALVIVVIVALIFLYPRIRTTFTTSDISPNTYLRTCIEPTIDKSTEILVKQGGYRNPEGYLDYKGEKIKYLCYTSEYYKTCTVQEPMIKNRFEKELETMIKPKAGECFAKLKEEYEDRNYQITGGNPTIKVSVIPNSINIEYSTELRIKKDDAEQRFDGFTARKESEMYDLLMIAQSIIDFESTYGDSETTLYLQYYPDLKIEKIKLGDGSKVYTLTNVVSGDKFTFASRSLAWPPGYGLEW